MLRLFQRWLRRRTPLGRAPTRPPRSEIERLEVEAQGEMRPPWAMFPHLNPYSIGFRMGSGESYAAAFWDWWRAVSPRMSEKDRLAYVRRWPGRAQWGGVMIAMIWNVDQGLLDIGKDTPVRAEWFARAERHGLPSMAACDADFDPTDGMEKR